MEQEDLINFPREGCKRDRVFQVHTSRTWTGKEASWYGGDSKTPCQRRVLFKTSSVLCANFVFSLISSFRLGPDVFVCFLDF